MNHCSRGSRVILLMCLLINTYIHMYTYTYVCIYILQLNSILIVLWVLDGFSKQSGGLFKSYSVHWEIHGFTLLKERLTCSWTTGLGQLKMMVYKCSSHSPRGQKEGKDPDQTILTSPVSAERRGHFLFSCSCHASASTTWRRSGRQPGLGESIGTLETKMAFSISTKSSWSPSSQISSS